MSSRKNLVVFFFLLGTLFYADGSIFEVKNTTVSTTIIVLDTVKKIQYVLIFARKSSHTVFFSPNQNIIYEHYSTHIYVHICVYSNVPYTPTILHRSHSHNNVKVLSLSETLSATRKGLVH